MIKTIYSDFYPVGAGVEGTTLPALNPTNLAGIEAELGTAADDSILTKNEKIRTLIPRDAELESAYTALNTRAGTLGISMTTTNAARTAWQSYRNALSPAWTDTTQDTTVVRTTFRTKINDYVTALNNLQAAISVEDAKRATWPDITGTGKPSDNAGSVLNLVPFGDAGVFPTITGNTIVSNPASSFLHGAYGTDYLVGTAIVSARVVSATGQCGFGLNRTQPITAADASYDYGIILFNTPTYTNGISIVVNSTVTSLGISWTVNDRFAITYDGVNVKWWKNGVLIHTVAASANLSHRPRYHVYLGTLADCLAVPYTQNNWDIIGGSAKPEDNATKSRVFRQPTAPAGVVTNDIWIDTSSMPFPVKTWTGTVWEISANYVTDTAHIDDGANLGDTALWIGVTGIGRPSDNAGTALKLIDMSAGVVTITGNTIRQVSGNGYYAVRSDPIDNACFVEADINQNSGIFTMIALDTDEAGTDYAAVLPTAQVLPNGNWSLYTSVGGYSGTAASATGKVRLTWDGIKYILSMDGLVVYNHTPVSPVQRHWPKFHAYQANQSYTGLNAGVANDARWTTIGGTTKPEDNATKSRMFRQTTNPSPGITPTINDIWIDTSVTPFQIKSWTGSAWEISTKYVTDTAHIDDGANLGGTALWTGVSGTGRPADNATVNIITYNTIAPTVPAPVNGDVWVDTSASPHQIKVRAGGVWQVGGNYVVNTSQIVDAIASGGAGLGTTAAWTGVSSRPTSVATLNVTDGNALATAFVGSSSGDNLIRNADLLANTAGWSAFGGVLPTRTAGTAGQPQWYFRNGASTAYLYAGATGNVSDSIPIEPFKRYTLSCEADLTGTMYLHFYNIAGVQLEESGAGKTCGDGTSNFTLAEHSRIAPAGAVWAYIQFVMGANQGIGKPRLVAGRVDTARSAMAGTSVSHNPDMLEVSPTGAPNGYYGVSYGAITKPTYADLEKTQLQMASAGLFVGTAFRVEKNTVYDVALRLKSLAAWSGGQVYFYIAESDTELTNGAKAVNGAPAIEAGEIHHYRDREIYLGTLSSGTTSFTDINYVYKPTTTAKWASIYVWCFNPGTALIFKRINISNKSTSNIVTRNTIAPSPAYDGDVWVDTSLTPNVLKTRVSGAWQNSGNLVLEGSHIGVENAADVTSIVNVVSDIAIKADHTGAVSSGELTRNEPISLIRNGTAVTTGITWTYKVLTGNVNGYTNASGYQSISGAGSTVFPITAVGADESTVEIRAVTGSYTRKATIKIWKNKAAAPVNGSAGGGTAASDTSLASTSSTTNAVVSDELIVTIGTAGTATITGSVGFDTNNAAGTYESYVTIQWYNTGTSSWDIVGSELATSTDCYRVYDAELNTTFTYEEGYLTINTSKTGLTAGSSQKFRLSSRNANAGTFYLSGTFSVQG